MIGKSGERRSGISVLAARHDDDDDDEIYIYIYIYTVSSKKKDFFCHVSSEKHCDK